MRSVNSLHNVMSVSATVTNSLEHCGSEHCDFHALGYPTKRECEMSSWNKNTDDMLDAIEEEIYCSDCSSKIKEKLALYCEES